ncbi:MAG: hypothetical protein ABGX16_04320 [Pirellulales bacterium]
MSSLDSYLDLSDEELNVVDAVCEQFERTLRSHEPVSITEQIENAPDNIKGRLFCELLTIELEFHRESGAEPVLTEYVNRYSDLETDIRRVFRESASNPDASSDQSVAIADPHDELIGSMIGPFKL